MLLHNGDYKKDILDICFWPWPKPFLCSLYYVVTDRYKLLGTDFYELSYLVLTSSNEANMLHCTKWNCVGFYLTWYESSGDNFYRETLTLQACQLRRSHTAVLSVEQLNSLNCFTWIIDSQNIPDQYVPEIYLFLRNEYIMTFTLPLSNAKWRGPLDVPCGSSLGLPVKFDNWPMSLAPTIGESEWLMENWKPLGGKKSMLSWCQHPKYLKLFGLKTFGSKSQ